MSTLRQCPHCHREHEVAENGTIATWIVGWTGSEKPTTGRYLTPHTTNKRLIELRARHPERYPKEPEEPYPQGFISNRTDSFIHHEDAVGEYNWIKGILVKRGDWEMQKDSLTLTEGERASWYELFESPDAVWMA